MGLKLATLRVPIERHPRSERCRVLENFLYFFTWSILRVAKDCGMNKQDGGDFT